MAYVTTYFNLNDKYLDSLSELKPTFGYNGFGEIVFYRTYSRIKSDGNQENWYDVVVRVINGMMTIRKDWYKKNSIRWHEEQMQQYAYEMAYSMFHMYWLPAGRGLWQMGTQFVFDRGSMSLTNCGFTKLGNNDSLANDLHWLIDALMLGVGVGFEPIRDNLKVYQPTGEFIHYVLDSREGWADAWRLLLKAFIKQKMRMPKFRFDYVRKAGEPIKGFGGLASGPAPLERLFKETIELFESFARGEIDVVRLKTDLANKAGVCVVAGNVRRSAELCKGSVNDSTFMNLKDYELHPEREDWGYMSNNAASFFADSDFEMLGEVARRVITRGEPGVQNLRNFKYGRVGKRKIPIRKDKADGLNPCGEIPLEDKELCNIVETLPTQCPTIEDWYKACEYASFYASTVSLLPTHREETNRVVVRNRRIGVGIIDWTGWVTTNSMHRVIKYMREGYKIIRAVNKAVSDEAGVPPALRVTTIKPGGTIPKLPGKTSGISYPTFRETLRRIRVAANNPICSILDRANIPFEPDFYDPLGTRVYEYPTVQGPALPAEEVSLWEQAMNLITVQREWADNAVSNTLYFRPMWKLICFRNTYIRPKDELMRMSDEDERAQQFCFDFYHEVEELTGLDLDEFGDGPIAINYNDGKYRVKTKLNKYGEWELYIYEYDSTHEEGIIEKVLSMIVPLIKSCSLLPHSAKGAYRQMPEEGITKAEYIRRLNEIDEIDWTTFGGSDGEDEKFCSGDACILPTVNAL